MNDLRPFGQLPIDERVTMFRAQQTGTTIQVYSSPDWFDCPHPTWSPDAIYRIAPEQPSINWNHVAPEYVALATDGNDRPYLYNVTEVHPDNTRSRWLSEANGFRYVPATSFASFKPGTCHWTESLVLRPEVHPMKIGDSVNRFINHYKCTRCDTQWEDESDCTNDDRCPECNLSMAPHTSEDL